MASYYLLIYIELILQINSPANNCFITCKKITPYFSPAILNMVSNSNGLNFSLLILRLSRLGNTLLDKKTNNRSLTGSAQTKVPV